MEHMNIAENTRIALRLNAVLAKHIARQVGEDGSYDTASEFIRDLIRKDMGNKQQSNEYAVATMLMAAENSPMSPLEDDFIDKEIELLETRANSQKDNRSK